MKIIKTFNQIEDKIIMLRNQPMLIDRDVAELYQVETKRINEAVRNNPDKFPEGYIIYLTIEEFEDLRSKISTAKFMKTRVAPKAFSEKGLYMLATVLKSPIATQTTIAIVETFTQIRELSRNIQRSVSKQEFDNAIAELEQQIVNSEKFTEEQLSEVYKFIAEFFSRKQTEEKPRKQIGFLSSKQKL